MNFLVLLLVFIGLFKLEVFFLLTELFSYKYKGMEESFIFVAYILIVFLSVFSLYLTTFLKDRRFHFGDIFLYIGCSFIFICHLTWVVFDNTGTSLIPSNLIFFVLLGLPGYFAVRILNSLQKWDEFIKFTNKAIIVLALIICFNLSRNYLTGGAINRGMGGESYQAISYTAALIFGLLLFFYINGRGGKKNRFGPVIRNIVYPLLIAVALFVLFFNGGRGAFVLMISYVTILVAQSFGGFQQRKIKLSILVKAGVFVLTLALFLLFASSNEALLKGLRRATAFIKFDASSTAFLDLKNGSSGRDNVYKEAIDGIYTSPWIGHGPFDHWKKVIQPHNLFIELLLQFGVILSFVISGLLISVLLLRRNLKPHAPLFLVMIGLYSLIRVMFSSFYLQEATLFFAYFGWISSNSGKLYPSHNVDNS